MTIQTATLFADKSDLYASARPQYPSALFTFISDLVKNYDQAWDCATGNGQAAIGLAQKFKTVQATDISPQQVANSLLKSNIHYSVSPAEQTTFTNNQFDLVSVAQALHWFDFEKFWPEVNRVLKPDGLFVTFAYAWFTVSQTIDLAVEKYIKHVIAPYWPVNNQLVWNHYQDVDFPFVKLKTPELTLQNHWDLQQFMDYMHTWSATRRCIEAKGMDFFEQAKIQIGNQWGPPKKKRLVISPLTVIAGKNW
ncbi:MAG: class I SAM-dependent methyltransferase [Paraglaciecola sp.]|uniref:class I SAM-dependent methyltransferase n=1 Tax=Paraglaciecola sp. TaxID=1920173 RepID=UPI003298D13D